MAYGGKRRRNPLPSIHDPADPSPDTLPLEARREWGEAYRGGLDVYKKDGLASRAAWREIRLTWKQTGDKTWSRCKNGVCYWPPAMRLPLPKSDLVGLGVLVEYVFLDKQGKLQVKKLDDDRDPPILWWDKGRKALYAFPKQPYPKCRYTEDFVTQEAVDEYKKFHERAPSCFDSVAVPDVKMLPVGAADSVSYASDKWNDPDPDPALTNAQQYIHNHWYDVWVWQDTAPSRLPNAIMIQGGELDLHARGLIH